MESQVQTLRQVHAAFTLSGVPTITELHAH